MTRRTQDRTEVVRRFLGRTYHNLAQQRQYHAEIDARLLQQERNAYLECSPATNDDSLHIKEQNASNSRRTDLLQQIRRHGKDKECENGFGRETIFDLDENARIREDKDGYIARPPRPSFLGLPVEIRLYIMELVLCAHPFLSSRQQITASSPLSHTDNEGSSETQRQPPTRPRISRFTHPSSSFKAYAESRQADTAVLFTCRQLRDEGHRLWYKLKYYLTLVIEQGAYEPDQMRRLDIHRRCRHHLDHCVVAADDRALRFDESDQERFWRHVARDLKFPSVRQAGRFRKFHISLFIEESAYRGVVQTGVLTGPRPQLLSARIVQILMAGDGLHSDAKGHKCGGGLGQAGQVGNGTVESGNVHATSEMSSGLPSVRFLDHTYLGLASDVVDDVDPHASGGDAVEAETRISLSVELWRV